MISLKDNLPVIQLASGQAIAFERDWLVRSLAQAAARAGYAKWWLAGARGGERDVLSARPDGDQCAARSSN